MSPEVVSHISDLLPAYVLGALSDDEMLQVASHVSGCASCRAELAQLQQVADDLPLALELSTPSPKVKESLMKAIRVNQAQGTIGLQAVSEHRQVNLRRMALPLAAIAVVVVLVLSNIFLWRELRSVSSQLASTFPVVTLANTSDSPLASGELVMNSNGQYGTLLVDKLATLDPTQQYQVWLVRGGERVSGGVFSVNPDGYASLEILAPAPLVSYDSIGISIEPFGGSPGPTGARVLTGQIPH